MSKISQLSSELLVVSTQIEKLQNYFQDMNNPQCKTVTLKLAIVDDLSTRFSNDKDSIFTVDSKIALMMLDVQMGILKSKQKKIMDELTGIYYEQGKECN